MLSMRYKARTIRTFTTLNSQSQRTISIFRNLGYFQATNNKPSRNS